MKEQYVTIGIPFYNSEKYLDKAIRSVFNQTYNNWFLILLDDGSIDASLKIAYKYRHDPRVTVLSDGENRGLPFRLNQLISLCETKYYVRMDSDDIMSVNRIEKQIAFMEAHPEYDVVGTSAMIIDNNDQIVRSASMAGENRVFIHPTIIGKTVWFKKNQYDEAFIRAEDSELWQRTYAHSAFYNLPEPLLFYREFGVPTKKKYLESQRTNRRILFKYKKNYSFTRFVLLYSATIVKSLLCIVLSAINKTDVLIRLRTRRPIDNEMCLTEGDLQNSIKKYSI